MPIVQLVDVIKKRKHELGLTIDGMSSKSGVGTRTINALMEVLELDLNINKKVY